MRDNAAFWNGIAEKYAKQPVANPDAFDAKIAVTKSHMKAADVVLDIGCGTGSLALRLAGSAAQVHGLDLSSEMIRIASGKAQAQGVDNGKAGSSTFRSRTWGRRPRSRSSLRGSRTLSRAS